MRKTIKITFMGLVALSISSLLCLAQDDREAKFLSIHEINRGVFVTEGYVVERLRGEPPYTSFSFCDNCKYSGAGIECYPDYPQMTCEPGVIVISEDNRVVEAATGIPISSHARYLHVYVKDAKKFELCRKYSFSLKLYSYSHQYQQDTAEACADLLEKEDSSAKALSIYEINSGIYKTEGFVVAMSICPPCCPGCMCGACAPDSITISEDNISWEVNHKFSDKELMVATQDPEKFEVGKKYSFSVRMISYSQPRGDNYWHVFTELVDYELMQ